MYELMQLSLVGSWLSFFPSSISSHMNLKIREIILVAWLAINNTDNFSTLLNSLDFYFLFDMKFNSLHSFFFFFFVAQYAKKSNDSLSKKEKLAISLASVLALFLLVFLVYWLVKRKRKGNQIYFHSFVFNSFLSS